VLVPLAVERLVDRREPTLPEHVFDLVALDDDGAGRDGRRLLGQSMWCIVGHGSVQRVPNASSGGSKLESPLETVKTMYSERCVFR